MKRVVNDLANIWIYPNMAARVHFNCRMFLGAHPGAASLRRHRAGESDN